MLNAIKHCTAAGLTVWGLNSAVISVYILDFSSLNVHPYALYPQLLYRWLPTAAVCGSVCVGVCVLPVCCMFTGDRWVKC